MIELVLNVVLVLTSVLLIVLILLHRGKGGGLSSMFGGAVSSSLAGSLGRGEEPQPADRLLRADLGGLHRRTGHPAQGLSGPVRPSPIRRANVTGDRPLQALDCAARR